jgi:hypothetical protein
MSATNRFESRNLQPASKVHQQWWTFFVFITLLEVRTTNLNQLIVLCILPSCNGMLFPDFKQQVCNLMRLGQKW